MRCCLVHKTTPPRLIRCLPEENRGAERLVHNWRTGLPDLPMHELCARIFFPYPIHNFVEHLVTFEWRRQWESWGTPRTRTENDVTRPIETMNEGAREKRTTVYTLQLQKEADPHTPPSERGVVCEHRYNHYNQVKSSTINNLNMTPSRYLPGRCNEVMWNIAIDMSDYPLLSEPSSDTPKAETTCLYQRRGMTTKKWIESIDRKNICKCSRMLLFSFQDAGGERYFYILQISSSSGVNSVKQSILTSIACWMISFFAKETEIWELLRYHIRTWGEV